MANDRSFKVEAGGVDSAEVEKVWDRRLSLGFCSGGKKERYGDGVGGVAEVNYSRKEPTVSNAREVMLPDEEQRSLLAKREE
jgi:hypothetical protein